MLINNTNIAIIEISNLHFDKRLDQSMYTHMTLTLPAKASESANVQLFLLDPTHIPVDRKGTSKG